MNVLLVSPLQNNSVAQPEAYPSGALVLMGTMLQACGHRVRLVHMASDGVGSGGLLEILREFRPEIVGITMSTYQTKSARNVSEIVKAVDSCCLVVVGGPHPSALKGDIFKTFPCVDVVVVGEGERTFVDIVESVSLSGKCGVCIRGQPYVPRDRETNLDYLPLPDLGLVDMRHFVGGGPQIRFPSMYIMAARGCPFKCTFCNRSVWGHTTRFRKPELVADEVQWLHEKYGMREIFFQDDTFNLNRKWVEDMLCEIIRRGLNRRVTFKTQFRANKGLVDADLLRLAKEAGFWLIFYGVESGSQAMLDAVSKGLTVGEIKRAFRLTHEAGLRTIASFMTGMPGETEETAEATLALWRELRPYTTGVGPAIPFPGTEFERTVRKLGHLLPVAQDYDNYSSSAILTRTDALTGPDLLSVTTRFHAAISRRFLRDLLCGRYWQMMVGCIVSPRFLGHALRRLWSYLTTAARARRGT